MLILIIILGWGTGAIINYVSDVLPFKRRLSQPFCSNCEKPQPLLNYFFWPRKCPHCEHSRTRRALIVELAMIICTVWLWSQPELLLGFWFSLILLIYFGIVVVIDLEHHLIMHPTSLIGSILGLIIGIQLHGILDTLLGGLAGFGMSWLYGYLGST